MLEKSEDGLIDKVYNLTIYMAFFTCGKESVAGFGGLPVSQFRCGALTGAQPQHAESSPEPLIV